MKSGFLSEYFEGVVAKRLSAVETDPKRSNQHEFNGVKALKQLLGLERLNEIPARFIWVGEENESLSEDCLLTWYDSRENEPHRSAEYRLYFYEPNPIMEMACEGDLLIVARRPGGELVIIVTGHGTTVENQLLWLFGVPVQIGIKFEYRKFEKSQDTQVDFAVRLILDELGIEVEEPETARFDSLLERFQGKFPKTSEFSTFSRSTLPDVIPTDDPDGALIAWMEREEKLFRRLERHIVSKQLLEGFTNSDGADVDGFISFSLSVQNRRKSRTGHAFEHHLEEIFRSFNIKYDRHGTTENKAKPDFLFPGQKEYHKETFPSQRLSMLGVKSTCKDRWRQVLSEANRIPNKHLITLEPGISENQTSEMKAQSLQLVLPRSLHTTYRPDQQEWLWNVKDFLQMVLERQE